MKNKTLQKGFTLVELIIVVAIIAVLASLAFMALSGETAEARDSKRKADLKVIEDSFSTSNGKNKKINYTEDNLGADSSGAARNLASTDAQTKDLETSSGVLQSIRGAYLLPVAEGLVDSDVLPTVALDPKGSHYFAAFLSSTDYSLYGTLENPNTKIPTAAVRGSFKKGAIIDVLTAGASSSSATLTVANPGRFVRGDVIKVDDETMVVIGRDIPDGTISVDRGLEITNIANSDNFDMAASGSAAVHNLGASVKLINPAVGGGSLVCYRSDADEAIVAESSGSGIAVVDNFTGNGGYSMSATPSGDTNGNVCDTVTPSFAEALVDGSATALPYKVN